MRKLGKQCSEEELDLIMKEHDDDDNGGIDY